MTSSLPGDLAIHSDGEHLILPRQLDRREIESIIQYKSDVLADLHSCQMDEAGFYTTLSGSTYQELQAVPWVVIKVETTAPTRFSTPERVSSGTFIGSQTWMAYRASHPDAIPKTKPRIRVLSLYADHLGACAWDLDALSPDDRQRLISVVLDNKIVVAHNAGLDLSWLFLETAARPAFVLDTMLLIRQVRPEALLRPLKFSLHGDEGSQAQCKRLIIQENGGPSASLDWIAECLKVPTPDSSYQRHTSWGVSILSAQHRQYAASTVTLPLRILTFLFPDVGIGQMQSLIECEYPWYIPYATSLIRLAEAHVRGVPVGADAAEKLSADLTASLIQAADDLGRIPEFARLHDQLLDSAAGETAAQKTALAEYVAKNGIALTETRLGVPCTTKQAGKVEDVSNLPAWNLLHTVQKCKSGWRVVRQYQKAAANDGRVHSLFTFEAATGRSVSNTPTVQNIPRDPRFRGIIEARPGNLILSVDYAAIELRIAALLAERAISDVRRRIEQGLIDSRFMIQVMEGLNATEPLRCPPEPDRYSPDWLEHAVPSVAQRVLRSEVQAMTAVFRRGLDPHLVTALDMAKRQGKIDFVGNPIAWLETLDQQTRHELKTRLHDDRQKAKPSNFGLLYGMTSDGLYNHGIENYGLSWSREEARQARNAWFQLYPEFRLWHWHTRYLETRPITKSTCLLWNSFDRKLINPQRDMKLYETSTLTGRPFSILQNHRDAVNYQDQGTGADILAHAIAALREDVAAMLLMPIHDELVFEIPANAIDEVRRNVVETMTQAADTVLGGTIPVEVETSIGETWGKT
jgi:DNA polymerase-1